MFAFPAKVPVPVVTETLMDAVFEKFSRIASIRVAVFAWCTPTVFAAVSYAVLTEFGVAAPIVLVELMLSTRFAVVSKVL
jgi:hypothetical protein